MRTNDKTDRSDSGASMEEVTRHLRETRESVAELIRYRMELLSGKNKSGEEDLYKINEFKKRAINAINNLFDEDL